MRGYTVSSATGAIDDDRLANPKGSDRSASRGPMENTPRRSAGSR